jgi:hypothetical protein
MKTSIILIDVFLVLVLSIIIYNLLNHKNINLPNLSNNIKEEKYYIPKSIGISLIIVIPIIILQLSNKKNNIVLGLNKAIRI